MTLVVEFTELALEDVEVADTWWRRNRPGAPDAIAEEIARVVALLAAHPQAGTAVTGTRGQDTRKLVLVRIGYHVYYRVTPTRIDILRFWHGGHRARPRL